MKYVIFGTELLALFVWFHWGVAFVGVALGVESKVLWFALGGVGLVLIVALSQFAHVAFKAR
jgi:hypothetical protein